jgi:hypothetical protein
LMTTSACRYYESDWYRPFPSFVFMKNRKRPAKAALTERKNAAGAITDAGEDAIKSLPLSLELTGFAKGYTDSCKNFYARQDASRETTCCPFP